MFSYMCSYSVVLNGGLCTSNIAIPDGGSCWRRLKYSFLTCTKCEMRYTKYSALIRTFCTSYSWTFPEIFQLNICSDIQVTCQENLRIFCKVKESNISSKNINYVIFKVTLILELSSYIHDSCSWINDN